MRNSSFPVTQHPLVRCVNLFWYIQIFCRPSTRLGMQITLQPINGTNPLVPPGAEKSLFPIWERRSLSASVSSNPAEEQYDFRLLCENVLSFVINDGHMWITLWVNFFLISPSSVHTTTKNIDEIISLPHTRFGSIYGSRDQMLLKGILRCRIGFFFF